MSNIKDYLSIREIIKNCCDLEELEKSFYLITSHHKNHKDNVTYKRLISIFEVEMLRMCGTF
ncbi:MAG: hypothetical protein ACOC3V_04155 [bacterium]